MVELKKWERKARKAEWYSDEHRTNVPAHIQGQCKQMVGHPPSQANVLRNIRAENRAISCCLHLCMHMERNQTAKALTKAFTPFIRLY